MHNNLLLTLSGLLHSQHYLFYLCEPHYNPQNWYVALSGVHCTATNTSLFKYYNAFGGNITLNKILYPTIFKLLLKLEATDEVSMAMLYCSKCFIVVIQNMNNLYMFLVSFLSLILCIKWLMFYTWTSYKRGFGVYWFSNNCLWCFWTSAGLAISISIFRDRPQHNKRASIYKKVLWEKPILDFSNR